MQGLPIQLTDGSTVTVPGSLTYLSTYVLLEQEDWFEKELPFVRRLLQPGMRALDIGANYGVYSVAMGRAVGPAGRVWCFEPSPTTFRFLRHTLVGNGLCHVAAEDCALSNSAGRGCLTMESNSELNRLLRGAAEPGVEVRIDTLDQAAARLGLQDIDFVKLDAEGEEVRIVAGGREFFAREDPVVMFELKHGHAINRPLLASFREQGYSLFRLVGPSELLVPLEDAPIFDGFELNLFACKPSRAAQLEQRGVLIRGEVPIRGGDAGMGLDCLRAQSFAAALNAGTLHSEPILPRALDAYAQWRQTDTNPARRYGALLSALEQLEAGVQQQPRTELLSLLARVSFEAGRRSRTVQVLGAMLNDAARHGLQLTAPTWPAAVHYDGVVPVADSSTWLLAATAQAMVNACAFSGYFAGSLIQSTLTLLDRLHSSPYASAPMERRRQLQQLQVKRTAAIEPSPLLSRMAAGHRNADFWRHAGAEATTMPASLLQTVA